MSKSVVLVTGASSGFGQSAARALAKSGHTVSASMRETAGKNAKVVAADAEFSRREGVDLRTVELDVQSETSCEAAVDPAKGIAEAVAGFERAMQARTRVETGACLDVGRQIYGLEMEFDDARQA